MAEYYYNFSWLAHGDQHNKQKMKHVKVTDVKQQGPVLVVELSRQ